MPIDKSLLNDNLERGYLMHRASSSDTPPEERREIRRALREWSQTKRADGRTADVAPTAAYDG